MEKTKVKKLVTSAITLSMAFSTLAPSMVFATDDVKPRDIVTKVNHALNGTATANNSETSYWGPDKAIDGIVNRDAAKPDQSRWSTNMGTTPMVLTIDLKEEKAFSEFKIEWERKNIKGFNISSTLLMNVEEKNQEFLQRLSERHPNLTQGERYLATLLRVNLSTKEISMLTGNVPKTINMNRYRLRKSLNLSSEDDLTDYLQNI